MQERFNPKAKQDQFPRAQKGGVLILPWSDGELMMDIDNVTLVRTGEASLARLAKDQRQKVPGNVVIFIKKPDKEETWYSFNLDLNVFKRIYKIAKMGGIGDYNEMKNGISPRPQRS